MNGLKAIEDLNLSIFVPNVCSSIIINKFISSEGRIHKEKIDTGDLDEDEQERFINAGRFLKFLGDRVTLSNKRNIQEIESEIESLAAISKKDSALALVSEVNAIAGDNVLGKLKALAIDLDIPIVALKTLPMECTNRPDKRSKLKDLNDADRMYADRVIFVYDDSYYNWQSQWSGLAEIIVAKNIAGSVGSFRLANQSDYCSFFNLVDENIIPSASNPTS
jgi:replicative DNA helicase